MLKITVTGGVKKGKSTVASFIHKMLEEKGFKVQNNDEEHNIEDILRMSKKIELLTATTDKIVIETQQVRRGVEEF